MRLRIRLDSRKLLLTSAGLLLAIALIGPALHHGSASNHKGSTSVAGRKDDGTKAVEVHVLPGSSGKAGKKLSQDVMSVAIMGTIDFDAMTVDPATVSFAGAPALVGKKGKYMTSAADLNDDGLEDLIIQFSLRSLQVGARPEKVAFRGKTFDGIAIEGTECAQASGVPCGGEILPSDRKISRKKSNFRTQAVSAAVIVSAGATIVTESCTPANGALDPGETVTVSFCVQNTGDMSTTNLVGTLQSTGGVSTLTGPQSYGMVTAGGPPVCRNFTFSVSGSCGGTVTATLQFQDGATNLGTVTYMFTLGVANVVFTENFDGVTAPALPAGWVSTTTAGLDLCNGMGTCALTSQWTTVTTTVDTAPNAAFHDTPTCVTDNTLDTPTIAITSSTAQLTFRNNFNLETNFDGAVLEISSPNINGGTFTDIITAGGSFVTGGYNATISVNFLSPIAGRQAWSGNSSGYITTTVNLPAAVAGQSIKLRFRVASDCNLNASGVSGQFVDTIRLTDGFTCCTSACTITCPANITVSNDPNQCGAVVNYPAPTISGTCGTVSCSPATGSFFPVGTTTVTCSTTAGPSCTFTVTVNDTQPPTITCPANITAVAAATCPPSTSTVVNFTTTASDNCPGVVVLCNPPSGQSFPVGTTTVTCTATDASGNTATCSFTVTVFSGCLQDDSNPNTVVLFNVITGQYRFCCGGTIFTGTGTVTQQGCTFTIQHNTSDRRVTIRVEYAAKRGTASLQSPPGTTRCTITDRDITNNTCACN